MKTVFVLPENKEPEDMAYDGLSFEGIIDYLVAIKDYVLVSYAYNH